MLRRLVVLFLMMVYLATSHAIENIESLEWQALAPMSVARSETGAVLYDNAIYVIGGLAEGQFGNWVITDLVEVYDIESDGWTTLSPFPSVIHHPIVTAYDGMIYVFGGSDNARFTPRTDAYAYDIESDTWGQIADLPRAMMATQATVIDDVIYIAGGDGARRVLAYDSANDSWQTWAASSLEHDHSAIVAVDNQIYVLGGRNVFVEDYSVVEIYDPQSDTWTSGTSMLEARAGFGAVLVDSMIIAFGGELLADNQTAVLQSSEYYDFDGDTWTSFIDLPTPLHGMPALTDNNIIYVVGGISDNGLTANLWALAIP